MLSRRHLKHSHNLSTVKKDSLSRSLVFSKNKLQKILIIIFFSKLTGTGKMPVADMRNSQCGQMSMSSGQLASGQLPSGQMATGQLSSVQLNGQHLASGHPTVSGLPPKSPLYALVNKASKKKSPPTNTSLPPKKQPLLQTLQHNYCNVSPLLGDVINKKPELFQKVQPNQVFASITR